MKIPRIDLKKMKIFTDQPGIKQKIVFTRMTLISRNPRVIRVVTIEKEVD